MRKLIETVRLFHFGFSWCEAWQRAHRYGQTAQQVRGDMERLAYGNVYDRARKHYDQNYHDRLNPPR